MAEEEREGSLVLGMRATATCRHCGKARHSANECWTSYPEKKPAGQSKVKCFACQKVGYLKRDCPLRNRRDGSNNNNIESITDYSKPRHRKHKCPIVDSGCTLHLTSDKDKLASPTTIAQSALIRKADGTTLKATHKGAMTLTHETGKTLTLQDVLLVPELSEDLISVKSLNEKGFCVTFTPDGGEITKRGQRWALVRGGGAWVFPEAEDAVVLTTQTTPPNDEDHSPKIDWQVMHERLGHASERKLRALEEAGLVKLTGKCEIAKCEPCLLCKPRRTNIPSAVAHSGEVVVQVDGMPWKGGYGGQSGAVTFSHRVNKVVYVYPYRNKSDAVKILDNYLTNQLPRLCPQATCIQTDAGTEFLSREWTGRCRRAGLSSRHAPPSCQAMNGQVEKDQATLAESARAMLRGKNIPDKYWPLALQTAAFIKNRTPHDALGGRLPVEAGTGDTLEPRRLYTFGCTAYVQIERGLRDGKGGDVRWKGMFAGYSLESPAWLILDPCSRRVREAYHVKFVESEPGLHMNQRRGAPPAAEVPEPQLVPTTMREIRDTRVNSGDEGQPEHNVDTEDTDTSTEREQGRTHQGDTLGLRRSPRIGTPRDLWDPSSPTTEGTEKLRRERQAYSNQALLAMAATVQCQENEPRSWKEAIRSKEWLASMQHERDTLKSAGAYTLVARDAGMRVESGIWRFRAKLDQDGRVAKLKSRYVLDGSR